mgnify:CR=1 FL=1
MSISDYSSKIVYYADYKKEGEEFNIDNLYKVPMYEEVEVEEPSFETKEVSKEVPYVSFDENGEEITLYHTVTKKEKVKTDMFIIWIKASKRR